MRIPPHRPPVRGFIARGTIVEGRGEYHTDTAMLRVEAVYPFLSRRSAAESEFYELSSAERRKKDRDFGRFIKSAKKDLRDD